ncbi:MAG: hypothetical protein RJA22_2876 [Verrucomicrobiota bacterium]
MARLPLALLLLALVWPRSAPGAFGLSSTADTYTVDTGAGLVFQVRRTDNGVSTQSAGDLMSLAWNGVNYQNPSRGSHVNSGFDYLYTGISSVTVTAAVVNVDYVKVTVTAGDLTHYYLARRGLPAIVMATHFTTEPSTLGLCRFIVRIPANLLPFGPAPSDIRNNTGAIESADIFGMADGTTRSKHYSNLRLKDWTHIGATGTNVGIWMQRSNHEGDSGGPFYRSLLNQCGSDQEITYILNYGEAQTEPFRTNILNGPYALVFNTGGPPPTLDLSWAGGLSLIGHVGPAGRGAVRGPGLLGRDTSQAYTVGFANGTAQYWTDAAPGNGSFLCTNLLPGTYTLTVFKNELAVLATNVTVSAGATQALGSLTITGDPAAARPLWRIGQWDGSPGEFLNGDRVTFMHPSDVRLDSWTPGPYLIGVSTPATGMPCYQWKDINGAQVVQFVLSAGQLVASTVRIGLTASHEGARPKINVNAWSSANPSPSSQPDTRTLTVGTYRGNNVTYTFAVPASAFVVGTNTLTIYPISGTTSTGWLSPGYSLDCLDFYQGTLQTLPIPAAPTLLGAAVTNLQVTLRWTAVPGATSYAVQRATLPGGPYTVLATGLAATHFTDTTVPTSTCHYTVRAANSSGTGTNSTELPVVAGFDVGPLLITAGSAWRYFDRTNDPGATWRDLAFNDTTWSNGVARLGYGNDGETTKIASNRQWSTYFRRPFHVPDPARVSALRARLVRDDAAVLYLNGAEIWRDTNLPSGTLTQNTPALVALAGADETNWLALDLTTAATGLLQSGWNLLAAEVHNQSLTSSDLGFDLELTARALVGEGPVLTLSPQTNQFSLSWPAAGSYFRPQSATNLTTPAWTRLATEPTLLSNRWSLSVPRTTPPRFYRLQAPPP